jgi:hypothetical protein
MAKSGLVDSRSRTAAAAHVGRSRVATNLTARPQVINSTAAKNLSGDGGKIIRLYPRAVAFRENPALPMEDKKGEYNVIHFPYVAFVKSTRQRAGKIAKSTPEIVTNRNSRVDDDYPHRMLENALAAAVLVVLVISGQWIFSTLLATFP